MNFLEFLNKTVCASKYFSVEQMRKIHNLGVINFGENYVQSLLIKKEELKDLNDIKYHLIGHLQTNKVKQVINEIDYLHTLDSIKLAKEIQKYRKTPLNCFIQVNLSQEDTKSGIFLQDLDSFIKELKKYDKINLLGLMTIGVSNDLNETENIFKKLEDLKKEYHLSMLSMGMSNDYQLAIKYNSDFLRIGSLFKEVI